VLKSECKTPTKGEKGEKGGEAEREGKPRAERRGGGTECVYAGGPVGSVMRTARGGRVLIGKDTQGERLLGAIPIRRKGGKRVEERGTQQERTTFRGLIKSLSDDYRGGGGGGKSFPKNKGKKKRVNGLGKIKE